MVFTIPIDEPQPSTLHSPAAARRIRLVIVGPDEPVHELRELMLNPILQARLLLPVFRLCLWGVGGWDCFGLWLVVKVRVPRPRVAANRQTYQNIPYPPCLHTPKFTTPNPHRPHD